MVFADLGRELRLDDHGLDVLLEVDLVAAVELARREHAVLVEQRDGLRLLQHRQRVDRRLVVRQAALLGLGVPLLRVAVAVEDDRAVLLR